MLLSILAEAVPDPTGLSGWWDIAQKVGGGATLAMGFGLWWMNRELGRRDAVIDKKDTDLKAEVQYSKDRDKQTLTVISELTAVVKAMDKRDSDGVSVTETNTTKILGAIADLRGVIIEHALGHNGRMAA